MSPSQLTVFILVFFSKHNIRMSPRPPPPTPSFILQLPVFASSFLVVHAGFLLFSLGLALVLSRENHGNFNLLFYIPPLSLLLDCLTLILHIFAPEFTATAARNGPHCIHPLLKKLVRIVKTERVHAHTL